jgi:hypothetical protein
VAKPWSSERKLVCENACCTFRFLFGERLVVRDSRNWAACPSLRENAHAKRQRLFASVAIVRFAKACHPNFDCHQPLDPVSKPRAIAQRLIESGWHQCNFAQRDLSDYFRLCAGTRGYRRGYDECHGRHGAADVVRQTQSSMVTEKVSSTEQSFACNRVMMQRARGHNRSMPDEVEICR